MSGDATLGSNARMSAQLSRDLRHHSLRQSQAEVRSRSRQGSQHPPGWISWGEQSAAVQNFLGSLDDQDESGDNEIEIIGDADIGR